MLDHILHVGYHRVARRRIIDRKDNLCEGQHRSLYTAVSRPIRQQPDNWAHRCTAKSAVREKLIVVLSSAAIAVNLTLRYLLDVPARISNVPLYLAIALGGAPLLWGLSRRLWRREFGADLLAGLRSEER